MSELQNLLDKYCPNGCEYKKIDDLCKINPKSPIGAKKAKELPAGQYPFFTSGSNIYYVDEYSIDGENIFINDGGVAGFNYYYGKANYADHVISIKPINISAKYMYYYLDSKTQYINSNMFRGTGLKNICRSIFFSFEIPVPPLPVQEEIVRILDKFTELETELETELDMRKKQYEYYRNKLLSLEDYNGEVEEITLGDIYKFRYGKGNNIPTDGGEYPVYGGNGICGWHNEWNSEDAPVIGHIGAYAGLVKWAKGKHFVTYNGVICTHINDKVDKRFAFYLLLIQDFLSEQKGSQPFVSYDALKKPVVKYPVDVNEQKRIVSLLDSFDKFIDDISEGLPAEIKLRHQQYEYYRDKLLAFKRLERETV